MGVATAAAIIGAGVAVVGTVHTIEQTNSAKRKVKRAEDSARRTKAKQLKSAEDRQQRIDDAEDELNPTGALGDQQGLGVFVGGKRK